MPPQCNGQGSQTAPAEPQFASPPQDPQQPNPVATGIKLHPTSLAEFGEATPNFAERRGISIERASSPRASNWDAKFLEHWGSEVPDFAMRRDAGTERVGSSPKHSELTSIPQEQSSSSGSLVRRGRGSKERIAALNKALAFYADLAKAQIQQVAECRTNKRRFESEWFKAVYRHINYPDPYVSVRNFCRKSSILSNKSRQRARASPLRQSSAP